MKSCEVLETVLSDKQNILWQNEQKWQKFVNFRNILYFSVLFRTEDEILPSQLFFFLKKIYKKKNICEKINKFSMFPKLAPEIGLIWLRVVTFRHFTFSRYFFDQKMKYFLFNFVLFKKHAWSRTSAKNLIFF